MELLGGGGGGGRAWLSWPFTLLFLSNLLAHTVSSPLVHTPTLPSDPPSRPPLPPLSGIFVPTPSFPHLYSPSSIPSPPIPSQPPPSPSTSPSTYAPAVWLHSLFSHIDGVCAVPLMKKWLQIIMQMVKIYTGLPFSYVYCNSKQIYIWFIFAWCCLSLDCSIGSATETEGMTEV